MRNFFSRLMYGRYGSDQLNLFLLGVWLVCYLLAVVFRTVVHVPILSALFMLLSYICIILELFRMFSRNYHKRRRENDRFLAITAPITHGIRQKRAQASDREHKYFKCPSCGQTLRVPKGKGKINVRCRNCGTTFQKKT